jgi:threonine dehydrogenase-like Zn-dependent dehydrogenase
MQEHRGECSQLADEKAMLLALGIEVLKMQISDYGLVVIGSGPAGQKCAIAVAKAGRASAEIVDARTPPPHHLIKQLTAGKTPPVRPLVQLAEF